MNQQNNTPGFDANIEMELINNSNNDHLINHSKLNSLHLPDQHPIPTIIGLKKQLTEIEEDFVPLRPLPGQLDALENRVDTVETELVPLIPLPPIAEDHEERITKLERSVRVHHRGTLTKEQLDRARGSSDESVIHLFTIKGLGGYEGVHEPFYIKLTLGRNAGTPIDYSKVPAGCDAPGPCKRYSKVPGSCPLSTEAAKALPCPYYQTFNQEEDMELYQLTTDITYVWNSTTVLEYGTQGAGKYNSHVEYIHDTQFGYLRYIDYLLDLTTGDIVCTVNIKNFTDRDAIHLHYTVEVSNDREVINALPQPVYWDSVYASRPMDYFGDSTLYLTTYERDQYRNVYHYTVLDDVPAYFPKFTQIERSAVGGNIRIQGTVVDIKDEPDFIYVMLPQGFAQESVVVTMKECQFGAPGSIKQVVVPTIGASDSNQYPSYVNVRRGYQADGERLKMQFFVVKFHYLQRDTGAPQSPRYLELNFSLTGWRAPKNSSIPVE